MDIHSQIIQYIFVLEDLPKVKTFYEELVFYFCNLNESPG